MDGSGARPVYPPTLQYTDLTDGTQHEVSREAACQWNLQRGQRRWVEQFYECHPDEITRTASHLATPKEEAGIQGMLLMGVISERPRFGNLNPWPELTEDEAKLRPIKRRKRPPNVPVHTLELQPEDALFAGPMPATILFQDACSRQRQSEAEILLNLAKPHSPHAEPTSDEHAQIIRGPRDQVRFTLPKAARDCPVVDSGTFSFDD